MNVRDLEARFDYGYWANGRLLAVVSQLTPEQFTRAVAGSYGSIRNTLVHILSAEAGWLDRCGGPARGPRLNPDDFPTIESVTEAWRRLETQLRSFLSSLKDDDLARTAEFEMPLGEKRSMTVGALMQHAANHGVHHRGQVALLLRMLGHAPGNVDLLIYYLARDGALGF
jgi:uncharacterized damage-inducible protein DinB